jgi:hypothetical protein
MARNAQSVHHSLCMSQPLRQQGTGHVNVPIPAHDEQRCEAIHCAQGLVSPCIKQGFGHHNMPTMVATYSGVTPSALAKFSFRPCIKEGFGHNHVLSMACNVQRRVAICCSQVLVSLCVSMVLVTSARPPWFATYKGVMPSALIQFLSAPASSKASATQ